MLAEVTSPVPLFVAGEIQHEGSHAPQHLGSATLLGRLSQDQLLSFFRESAIYICTSRYEPFGLAPLEAALCGCAVLARDISSLREVWKDAARYFSDANSLSELLHEFAEDPGALHAAQRRSQTRAQFFTAERMVDGYRAEFARALNQAEASSYAA
jgi:glycosyltransferase involved in cell wall biosynthesis